MRSRLVSAIFIAFALTAAAAAQDAGSAPPPPPGQGPGGAYGQHGGRGGYGGMGGGMGMMGRGLTGTVTEVAADHYTIKTDQGDVYAVHFTADTRILKQVAGAHPPGGGSEGMSGGGQRPGGGGGGGFQGNPPQPIRAADIKVGDVVGVMGPADAAAKTVNATAVLLMDPERVKQMREMEANFGKTWLQGKVTAIDGAKITLTGVLDNAPHVVVADENTEFRRRREPVTLADIAVGDNLRVEGAVKDGVFTATSVNVAGMAGGETPTLPRNPPPQ
ncbi:MAG: DUF5666 domain-containing protein [Terracidiphilus sp.]